jgi:hypothetical protein
MANSYFMTALMAGIPTLSVSCFLTGHDDVVGFAFAGFVDGEDAVFPFLFSADPRLDHTTSVRPTKTIKRL